MKKAILPCIMLGLVLFTYGQDSLSQKDMDEIYIYSNMFVEKRKNIVQKIDIVSAQRIAQMNAQNTGDLLINTGNIFVQKSQQGGSSPVIRGFEASRVLLVVDGIRMNNAIYRSGHLQNVITIDQNMLERVEVLYGPASTLYGSDALGGVIHFRTKAPKLSITEKKFFTGSAFARFSSANKEKTFHVDLSTGAKKFAWLQSYNYSDFDDVKMGSHYPKKYPDFGRRPAYIANINGTDSVIMNRDDRIQKFSGYQQWDITEKFFYKPNERVSHLLNFQYSNSGNVPRYDRLQDKKNGMLRFAEWYYGPQQRALAAYEFSASQLGFIHEFKTIISYQHIEESRYQREYRRYDRLDIRKENLDVLAVVIDGRNIWGNHELTVGMDAQFNDVKSVGIRKNKLTGNESPLDSRYPNGKNNMNYLGVFAQHLFKFGKGKFILNDGIRLQGNQLRSSIVDNSFFQFPFTSIKQDNVAITGNMGLIYMPTEQLRINAGLATGFRAPNIDDLARIFESNTASRQLIVPNPDITPEYTYNADLGFAKSLDKFRLEAGAFYTLLRRAIALAPFRINGQDSVNFNGTASRVFANQNVNKAVIYGFNASFWTELTRQLAFTSTINYTYGRLFPSKAQKVPLDHIPPVYGKTALIFTNKRIVAECYSLYNGWKKIKDYNPSGEDNSQYATPDGTPAWFTINFKTTVKVHEQFSIQAGIENLLDRNYRHFASGFSSAGRNFVMALRTNF